MGKGNLRLTSSLLGEQHFKSLYAIETAISCGSVGHFAGVPTLPFLTIN